MDGVERQVGEEGLVLVGLDECGRLAPEAQGEGFAGLTGLEVGILPGREEAAARAADVPAALVDVEAVIGRPRALAAEVPFSGEEGLIARIAQDLGKSVLKLS